MIRKNMKLIVGFVIGLLITSAGVYAANSLSAGSISIDKSKMSKVPESNLQSALDYLYNKSKTNNMITIESGIEHDTQTYLGIVYLDPTNLSTKCTAQNSISTTGTKIGCMKWYIYKDLGDSYKMILDHNTTAGQAWNTRGDSGTNVAFAPNTTGDSSYDNLVYIELMKLVDLYEWQVIPDLISAEEVAEIVGKTGFTNTSDLFYLDSKNTTNYPNYQGGSNYAWLFNYTKDCLSYGCNIDDNSNYGYWTKTTWGEAGSGSAVWSIIRNGYLDNTRGAINSGYGLRPVITISKNLFNN